MIQSQNITDVDCTRTGSLLKLFPIFVHFSFDKFSKVRWWHEKSPSNSQATVMFTPRGCHDISMHWIRCDLLWVLENLQHFRPSTGTDQEARDNKVQTWPNRTIPHACCCRLCMWDQALGEEHSILTLCCYIPTSNGHKMWHYACIVHECSRHLTQCRGMFMFQLWPRHIFCINLPGWRWTRIK